MEAVAGKWGLLIKIGCGGAESVTTATSPQSRVPYVHSAPVSAAGTACTRPIQTIAALRKALSHSHTVY
eukprot:5317806-Prymnesium_polylepis.2